MRPTATVFFAVFALTLCGHSRSTLLLADDAAPGKKEETPARDPSVVVRLVRSEVVQRELALSPEQRADVKALIEEIEYPLFLVRNPQPTTHREQRERIADQVEDVLGKTLTAAQRQRLLEIVLRAQGWPAVISPAQAERLKLTPAQLTQIEKKLEEASKDAAAGRTLDRRILKLLSGEQQSELTALLGKPFDLTQVPQVACRAPELRDVTDWINTQPLTLDGLRGQVVALHFFAFACSNCINNQPHYKAWHERYAGKGVTVLGLHTPETASERDIANLRADVAARQIGYPIAVDAKASNWAAWANTMWPSVYLIDRRGYIRAWWYGELNWQGAKGEEQMRKQIDALLSEKE